MFLRYAATVEVADEQRVLKKHKANSLAHVQFKQRIYRPGHIDQGKRCGCLFPRIAAPHSFDPADGSKEKIIIEVIDHIDLHKIRGIALTATAGLAREDPVKTDGEPLLAPVGEAILGRMFNVFGEVIDGKSEPENTTLRSVHQRPIELAGRVSREEILPARHKGHRPAYPSGKRGKGRAFRWRRGGKNCADHRTDPQHGGSAQRGEYFLRHRRTVQRRRGVVP